MQPKVSYLKLYVRIDLFGFLGGEGGDVWDSFEVDIFAQNEDEINGKSLGSLNIDKLSGGDLCE